MFNEVENFVFDKSLNRQVFKCFENKGKMSHVGYKLGVENQGTITLRFKYEDNNKVKPLISISNTTSENILVFINSYNELKIKVNEYEYSQYIPLNPKTWYEVILSMNSSSGLVYVKGYSTLCFTNNINNITNSIIKVGANKDNTLSLNGYIERLGIAKKYIPSSELPSILDCNVDVLLKEQYDSINRLKAKTLQVNELQLTKEYTYKTPESAEMLGTSLLVETETLLDGRKQEYQYDDYGNVTRKTLKDSNNKLIEQSIYTYDRLFRLVEEETSTYENNLLDDLIINKYTYDNNGNRDIVTKEENGTLLGNYKYEYDTNHKDRLVTVKDMSHNNEEVLTVSYTNSFTKPSQMVIDGENNNLTWQGRNLISQDLYDVTYTYNSSGLRTSKQVNNVLTKYIYEGSKLIGKKVLENNVETTLIYNYDHQNKIMGLSIGNKEYFYIKDILENIIGIIDQEGNVVVYYRYDAYGNLLQEDIKINNLASRYNDILYKGYVYDRETGLAMVGQRYYSPELGRFIQPADVSSLNSSSINGLNLYSYANNNPIGIAYSSFGATFGTSGGMIGSTRGTIGNIVGSGSEGGESKISGFGSLGGSSFSSINWPKANSVAMTHYTTSLIKNPFISWMLGNISYTKTVQLNSAETFYSFSNIGNDGYSAGVGFNFGNWYGGSVYVSSDIGFGSSWQLTPWLTGSSGWSLENGISISGGVIIGDTTHEITVSIGNGALLGYAACAGIAAIPVPGARAVAATAACIIFIIDLFN